jgi:addiction module HigA family antidote
MTTSTAQHPGLVVKEWMKDSNINASQLSKALDVSEAFVCLLLKGQRQLSFKTAILLGNYFGNGYHYWTDLQKNYWDYQASQGLSPRMD